MSELILYSEEERALLVGLDLGVAGEENLNTGDIGMPPRLRISQPNRPIQLGDTEITPGHVVNTMTGETWERLDIVPLVFLPSTRVMWPEAFSESSKPECVSNDGENPDLTREDLANPQPGPCVTCPMSQFVDGGKPRCNMQRNFLVWLVGNNEPAILTMQSTGIKEAKNLTALAKMSGIKKAITLTTRKVRDERGQWFVPQFIRGDVLPVQTILLLVEARNELANLVITADTAEPVNGHDVVGQVNADLFGDPLVQGDEEVPF